MEKKVEIKKIVSGGMGLAFLEGKTVFVKNALIGETVLIKILKEKSKIIYALADGISTPSPLRINPECAHYPLCGGCDFLHTNYENEIKLKSGILNENIKRFLSVPFKPNAFCPSDKRFGIRNTAVFHMKEGETGFYDEFKNVFDIKDCLVLNPLINDWLKEKKEDILKKGVKQLKVKTNGIEIADCFNKKRLLFDAGGVKIYNSYGAFVQRNFYIIARIIKEIKNNFSGKLKTLIDAYGGSGVYSFHLQKYFDEITIAEPSKTAYFDFLKTNKKYNFQNIKFKNTPFENFKFKGKADVLIINPPRSGLTKKAVLNIKKIRPQKIFYVSCGDVAMMRDINGLLDGYEIKDMRGFDMFPGTKHFEVLAVLTKRSGL